MNYARLFVGAGCAAALTIVVACSGGTTGTGGPSGGGGSTVQTSVDSSKNVNSLTDSESNQYCQDLQAFITQVYSQLDFGKLVCQAFAAAGATYGSKSD